MKKKSTGQSQKLLTSKCLKFLQRAIIFWTATTFICVATLHKHDVDVNLSQRKLYTQRNARQGSDSRKSYQHMNTNMQE